MPQNIENKIDLINEEYKWSLEMKKMMVLFIILLGIRGQAESSDRGVIEVTEIKKFKSRNPKKSLYKFSGRVLIGENDCLAKGVKLKYRRFLEEEVDYFWIQKDGPPDLENRFCTKEFKPVYSYFTQRITSKKLILFNVLNMGKVDADTLLKTLQNGDRIGWE